MTQDHAPTDQQRVNALRDAKKKDVKEHSDFHDLLRSLNSAAAIVEYVEKNFSGALRLSKGLNSFLQALSSRPADVYSELFTHHKPTVVKILERLVDQVSGKHGTVLPSAHEWVLRCEAHGVKKAAWSEEIAAPQAAVEGQEAPATTLLSPKELIAKIVSTDPQGHMLRRIELCETSGDIARAAKLLMHASYLDGAKAADAGVAVARLVSKARRVLGAALAAATATSDDCGRQSSDAIVEMRSACSCVLESSRHVFESVQQSAGGVVGTIPLPLAKLQHFTTWARGSGLLEEHLERAADDVATQSSTGLEQQALQMETVLKLKSSATETEFTETLDSLLRSAENDDEGLLLSSPDVLSAVAVAASSSGFSQDVKSRVVRVLVATQRTSGAVLPRRALTFVSAEKNRVKQERRASELKRQRDEEEAAERRTTS